MSYYSMIDGHIEAQTARGKTILEEFFASWLDPKNQQYGALVSFEDNTVVFEGSYRNAGRFIESAILRLRAEFELKDVSIHESTTDGFVGTYHYVMDAGIPVVNYDGDSGRGVCEVTS